MGWPAYTCAMAKQRTSHQQPPSEPSALVSVDVAAERDRVWDALVTDGGLGPWMGDGATIDPRPGGRLSFPDPVGGSRRDGRVDAVDDQARLEFVWWTVDRPTLRSRVTISLDEVETGTRVTVRETALARPAVGFELPTTRPSASAVIANTAITSTGRLAVDAMSRSASLVGLWSWRLAMVTVASQMVRV